MHAVKSIGHMLAVQSSKVCLIINQVNAVALQRCMENNKNSKFRKELQFKNNDGKLDIHYLL